MPSSKEDIVDVSFENILAKLHEHIDNPGVDAEVWTAYRNILREKTLIPIQCAFFVSMHHLALKEAYTRRRQVRKEDLSRTRKFTGQIKIWVLELKDLDLKHSLGEAFEGNLSFTVRVFVEGQVKGTTKSSPVRSLHDGSLESLKINQDVDFYVKRPTSVIHIEILHINDDEPEGSLTRETLIGGVVLSLRQLESQKTVRQWYTCVCSGHPSANLQLRMNYTYREEILPKWDPEAGLPRSEEQGGAEFNVGMIGAGQIGTCVLDAILRSGLIPAKHMHVSTRRPETLSSYEKLGVNVCFDNAKVAAKVDVLILACQPKHITQIASIIRGKIRQETLIVSLIAGMTSERISQLLQVTCVVRTQIGTDVGLPPPAEQQLAVAATRVEVQTLTESAGDQDKRRVAQQVAKRRREAEAIANVATAVNALVPDADKLEELIISEAKLGTCMGLHQLSAKEVGQGAVCNALIEQRILGYHVPMEELRVGSHVRIIPPTSDMLERIGVVKHKLHNREEYVVTVQGKDVRSRRNRLVEEGVVSSEEGFSLLEYREMQRDEQWSKFKEHMTRVGELCICEAIARTSSPGEATVEPEKSSGFDKGIGGPGRRRLSVFSTTG